MRQHRCVLVAPILLAGCHGSRPTSFYSNFDARAELCNLVSAAGLKLDGGEETQRGARPSTSRDFSVTIKGTEFDLTDLFYKYRALIDKAITSHGMRGGGRRERSNGAMRSFELRYRNSGEAGVVRVNAVLDKRGYMHFDVLMYEDD
jgi:hypothetical protein